MANTINNGTAKSLAYYPATGTDIDDAGANLKWDPATNMVTLVGRLQINKNIASTTDASLSIVHYGSTFVPMYISRSLGTTTNPAKVTSGSGLGGISFTGRADSVFKTGAYINAVVDGAVNDNSMPSKIVFGTHNGNALEARAELSKLGELKINTIKNFSGANLTLSPAGQVIIDVNKLNITGGSPGQVLSLNSGGALTWTTITTTGTVSDSTIRKAINAGTGISYNKNTGYITNTITSTSSLAEGSNLYFTEDRVKSTIDSYIKVAPLNDVIWTQPLLTLDNGVIKHRTEYLGFQNGLLKIGQYSGDYYRSNGTNRPMIEITKNRININNYYDKFVGTYEINNYSSSINIGGKVPNQQYLGQAANSINIGGDSAEVNHGVAIGIGASANQTNVTPTGIVSIGYQAGSRYRSEDPIRPATTPNDYSVAVGYRAGMYSGTNSISLGKQASATVDNSIVINATGTERVSNTSGFFVDPIRNVPLENPIILYYNTSTKEITYGESPIATGGPTTIDTLTDVVVNSPTSGQILKYNGSTWENGTNPIGFSTIAISGNIGSSNADLIADSGADTLTINAGTGIILSTNTSTDTLTISNTIVPGPVFMAYNSQAQSIASGSSTMNLIYSTATTNTSNYYNTSTGIFTPLVAGFYQVNASIYPTGGTYGSFFLGIYKNGSPISMGSAVAVQPGWGQPGASSATVLVYLNGTTDNINCKLTTTSATGSWTTIVSPAVFFQSVWIRGA